jgi:hypothetical protein
MDKRDVPRLLGGWVAYPAASVLLWFAVSDFDTLLPALAVLLVPAFVAGLLVRRPWLYGVPVLYLGVWATIAGWGGRCTDCSDDYSGLVVFFLVLYGGASLIVIGLGHIVGNVLARRREAAPPL